MDPSRPTDSVKPVCPEWLHLLTIGVVMLNTRFPRAQGDIGNPSTLFGRGLYRRVPSATVASVISESAIASEVSQRILDASCELASLGADAVLTSCGFLQEIQHALQQRIDVPVISSALCLLPDLLEQSGDARVGILTFNAARLADRHLGVPEPRSRCVLIGMESSSHFHPVIAEDRKQADPTRLRADVLEAAEAMAVKAPAAVILECTNLSPWKHEIERIVDVPVYDLMDALRSRMNDLSVDEPVGESVPCQGPSESASS